MGEVFLPTILILALLAGTIVLLMYRPKWGFLGACFFLLLAPTSSVLPIISEVVAIGGALSYGVAIACTDWVV